MEYLPELFGLALTVENIIWLLKANKPAGTGNDMRKSPPPFFFINLLPRDPPSLQEKNVDQEKFDK